MTEKEKIIKSFNSEFTPLIDQINGVIVRYGISAKKIAIVAIDDAFRFIIDQAEFDHILDK